MYRLFSQTKITGSFQTAAKFSASWKAPILVVPSPKKQTETSLSPLYWARQAAPQVIGSSRQTARRRMCMPPIGAERQVAGLHGDRKAGRHRLLAEREMAGPLHKVLQE